MKLYQRLFIGFVALLFVFPTMQAEAKSFSDVERYHDEINFLVDQEILTGYPDGSFKPDAHMSRLNGVQVLLKAKGVTDFDAPDPGFTDMTPGTHGYEEVAKAVELGIISGKTNADGTRYFDPKGSLTRGQMAKIIVETMGYPIDTSYTFRDVTTSNGYFKYTSTLAVEGVTEGYQDNTFKPYLAVSRQHFSLFVARMLNDAFKPEPKPKNFALDPTFDYVREYYQGGDVYLETLQFIGKESNGHDRWKTSSGGGSTVFTHWEDANGLYTGFPESEFYVDLRYPIYKGKVFDDGWDTKYTVTDIGLTVKTKAGTFNQVIAVKTSYGTTTYYAPNIGPVKSVSGGKTTMELVELKARR